MKILDRLDELREKATKGPWETTGEGYGWVWPIQKAPKMAICEGDEARTEEEREINASRIVTACNAEEAMVRVCRAVWEVRKIRLSRDDPRIQNEILAAEHELDEALQDLREIEP